MKTPRSKVGLCLLSRGSQVRVLSGSPSFSATVAGFGRNTVSSSAQATDPYRPSKTFENQARSGDLPGSARAPRFRILTHSLGTAEGTGHPWRSGYAGFHFTAQVRNRQPRCTYCGSYDCDGSCLQGAA